MKRASPWQLLFVGIVCLVTAGGLLPMAGCAARNSGVAISEPARPLPVFAILYHPTGPALARTLGAPIPDYHNWPAERMERDIRRLCETGVDLIFCTMALESIRDADDRQRYEQFLSLMATGGVGTPRLAFWLEGSVELANLESSLFYQWLLGLPRDTQDKVLYLLDGKPLVILAPPLGDRLESHPALSIRRISTRADAPPGAWKMTSPATPSAVSVSDNGEMAFVVAGMAATRQHDPPFALMPVSKAVWRLPRNRGASLTKGFNAALALRPQVLCIWSWNDFTDGSFVEPNTEDGTRLMEALKRDIGNARKGR